MQSKSACCDFCGDSENLQQYPTADGALNWYACADCAGIIDDGTWNQLIERSLAAYSLIRPIADGERPILREHVAQLVHAFRSFRLVAV
jgi:hypothetical protein